MDAHEENPKKVDGSSAEGRRDLEAQPTRVDANGRLMAEPDAFASHVRGVLEGVQEGFIALDDEWRFTYVNEIAARILNREQFDLAGRHIWSELPDSAVQWLQPASLRAVQTQRPVYVEDSLEPHGRWLESRIYPTAEGLAIFLRDVTQRRHREDELQRMNRALTAVTACNRALLRATDERELIGEICLICVEIGGYRLAWVGYAENDETKRVRPVGESGFDAGYLDIADIRWSDTPRGRGPTGTAIRTRSTVVARDIMTNPDFDPWRESALQHGFRSSIAIPLVVEAEVVGALNIYSQVPDAFDTEEVGLLEGFAADLSYGIEALRAREPRDAD